MSTSRQKEMRERLPKLIEECVLQEWNIMNTKGNIGQKYSRYIIDKYLKDERYIKNRFENLTTLAKDSFYKLYGISVAERVEEATLLYCAFGLGISYEEAVLLFSFYDIFLFSNSVKMNKIDNVLKKLDSRDFKDELARGRLAYLHDLLKDEGIGTLVEKMDKKCKNEKRLI